MTLQPNEARIREDFTLDKGPTFRVRALRKVALSVTRVTYGMAGPAIEAHAGGGENALLALVPLTDVSACEQWIDGRHHLVPPMKRCDTAFVDPNLKHISYVPPSDLLLFHMPCEAFDAIADQQSVRRIESFRVQSPMPLDDHVFSALAPLLQAALEQPEQANYLFTDYIAMALLTHVARTSRAKRLNRSRYRPRSVSGRCCPISGNQAPCSTTSAWRSCWRRPARRAQR
jgi:AraC family transcriptional regulator